MTAVFSTVVDQNVVRGVPSRSKVPAGPGFALGIALAAGWLCLGCSHPPVVLPDAADLLATTARNHVSLRAPTRELGSERLDEVPQGARCVVETTDSNPLRVVSGTVLLVSPDELVLRDGMVRRLDQKRLQEAVGAESAAIVQGSNWEWKLRDAIEEQRFEELRLQASEIQRVSVYGASQASWKRLPEHTPQNAGDQHGAEPEQGGWRPANRGT